jgi:stage IV sporulation protein B
MTFFDPQSRRYGALGHVIADMDTNRPIEIEDGQIVAASVSRIEPGKRGQPGEKIGTFSHNRDAIGTIDRNTPFGIMGYLFKPPECNLYSEPLPIAMMNEVRPGPAKIVTVISGRKLEEFDVEIVRVNPQPTPHAKGMVIKVVDRRLLAATGGIVQGMSGSPIIQDGRLVGAVTHVFVNDPTKGYGVFIEWMIIDSGILESQQNISAA